ncbi:MAG TPA: NADH:flavin oxidoreductase/NADH oxidase [Pyrinomonadaceae bacterium]
MFSSFSLRGVEFRNRVFVSPMCQYSSREGFANDWHFVHLGSRAVGGAALVVAEATAVSPEGRISPGDTGLWSDAHAEAFRPAASFIRSQGAVAGIQLAHAGRKASTDVPWRGGGPLAESEGGWQVIAPSAVPFAAGHLVPREMTAGDIDGVVSQFVAAARRSLEAGFEVVELHMAHGYLLHEFLSPLSNKREDEYGGDFDGRVRFPLRVAAEVRRVWPERLPLFARVSATDWVEGGWDLAQTVELAKRLRDAGVDLIDCSSGGIAAGVRIAAEPGYQVPFAEAVRKEAGIATGAVGLITEAEQAERIVSEGRADAVFLARAMLRDPYWALRAAKTLGAQAAWPAQYGRADG